MRRAQNADTHVPMLSNSIGCPKIAVNMRQKIKNKKILVLGKFTSVGAGITWYNTGLVIERLQVRIPAGAVGEFSSPGLTLCADSCGVRSIPLVTAVARKRPRSFCQKCGWHVTAKHAYTLDPPKLVWADCAAAKA